MIERISQSFQTTMQSYMEGEECGNVVAYQYIEGKLLDRKSDAMAEGSYFEFLLTGALPKGGKVPQPKYMSDPLKAKAIKDLKIADMLVDYRRAHINAERVKAILDSMGLVFISVGKKLTKGNREGTIDIICECTKEITFANGVVWKVGDRIVLDIKYSGLLYDKWKKFGWEWSDVQKKYHGPQAVQYHYITNGLPFYFLVVSNTNKEEENQETGKKEFGPTDMRLFRVPIDEHMIEVHLAKGNQLFEELKFQSEIGLIPRPGLLRCGKCPLYSDCKDKATFPQIEDVDLTIGI